jgi:predicted permease
MRFLDWLLRRRREDDLEEEIRAHLAMATRDRIEGGEQADSARFAVLKEFGNVTQTREKTRRAWGGRWRGWMVDLVQDVRYAGRVLRASPGYALVVIAVLAVGLAANVAVFSLFKAVFIKPLPGVYESARIAVVVGRTSAGRIIPLSHPDFLDLQARNTTFSNLAGVTQTRYSLGLGTRGETIWAELVTGNYFEVLGVRAQRGRTLLPTDDEAPGRHPVAVISDAMWRRVFGADEAIVGRTIQIAGYPFEVVGVAAPDFHGSIVSMTMDVFVPVMMRPQLDHEDLSRRNRPFMWGLGRLRGESSIAAADTDLARVWDSLDAEHTPEQVQGRAAVIPMWQSPYGAQTYMLPALVMMSAMGALLMLIVCANVANLVLVRGVTRRGEIAARLALGASRGRIVRLLLVESLVLSVPAGVAGTVLSGQMLGLMLNARMPTTTAVRSYLDASVDGVVILFALAVACGSAAVFSLVPALRSARVDLAASMKDDLSPRGGSRGRLRATLVVAQVAVSLLLLVGVGLVMRSVDAARGADGGFDQRNVAVVSLDVTPSGYDEARGRVFYARLLDAVRSRPGIESASLASSLPLSLVDGRSNRISVEGYVPKEGEDTIFLVNRIADGYFETMRIPLLAGRDFEDRDGPDSQGVVIVNETMAARFWGGAQPALGRRLRTGDSGWKVVVGVARDIKYARLTENPRPHVYEPFDQQYAPERVLHVRGRDPDERTLIETARASVASVDPTMPILWSTMLREQTKLGLAMFEIAAGVLSVFGVIAMALAALGTYGLIAYAAKQSTHEIGIRIAVGASRGHVARRFLQRGLRLGAIGAVLGLLAAGALTRLLAGLLYGVSAFDLVSFAAALAAVLLAVLTASSIPAWRASRTDPIAALRHR